MQLQILPMIQKFVCVLDPMLGKLPLILRVHGIFTTSKNTTAVFLAIGFYNCEFDKIMTGYCHIHSSMPNLHLTF